MQKLETLVSVLAAVVAVVVLLLLAVRTYQTGQDIGVGWVTLLAALLGVGRGLQQLAKKGGGERVEPEQSPSGGSGDGDSAGAAGGRPES